MTIRGELALEGGGNPAVFGGWQRPYGNIRGGQWYRLQVRYQAAGLGFEPLQTPIRLDWTAANGKRAGQPDYAWRVTGEGGWRLVSLDAPAPENASPPQFLTSALPRRSLAHARRSSSNTVRIRVLTMMMAPPNTMVAVIDSFRNTTASRAMKNGRR